MELIKLVIGRLQNNCYILNGDGRDAVIVDPSGQYPLIAETLDKRGLSPAHVMLTHGHFDHTGAARKLQAAGARIYLHPADLDKINAWPGKSEPFAPDIYLEDGQILKLAGLEIEVIHTPGHTGGGVCFLVGGTLFSGDTLFRGDVGRTDLPSGDYGQLVKSIRERLFALPSDTRVLPGHEEETTVGEASKTLFL
ncbi:MAG: MBL fold metallo-hydrolase [Firmicutes bacterium]|nr:MBL fold metallo-hydrolase [Bacillota bacterium]